MQSKALVKAAILMLLIVTITLVAWEIRLRKIGVTTSYDAGDALWADKRAMVYEPKDKATVFIGSSRIHYDIDIPTWEAETHNHAIQLGCDGSSPLPVLFNLAEDSLFKGALVIDITEGLFFSTSPFNNIEPEKFIKYYKDRTYAQRASFMINKVVESQLVFLDKDNFSMNAYLSELKFKNRPHVFEMPIWPWQFGRITFDNQEFMNQAFVSDSNLHIKVQQIWTMFAKMAEAEKPLGGVQLDTFINQVKTAVFKIKARGGKVFFTRTPSSGPYLQGEQMAYPRDQYWERILRETQSEGMHFLDYPETKNLLCPEWSHLAPNEAIVFTKALIQVLRNQKDWKL